MMETTKRYIQLLVLFVLISLLLAVVGITAACFVNGIFSLLIEPSLDTLYSLLIAGAGGFILAALIDFLKWLCDRPGWR